MAQPRPRSNLMQTLLIAVVIWLGLSLIFNRNTTPDPRSSDEILTAMRELNAKGEDLVAQATAVQQIQAERTKLEARLNAEVEAKKLTKEEAFQKRLQGYVLTADTLFRAGATKGDLGPLTQAYYLLHGERPNVPPQIWTGTDVDVTPTARFPEKSITPEVAYRRVVTELGVQSKNHKILGFLPGYKLIDSLVALTGRIPSFSYAFAALLLALIVRTLIWPLAQRQYMWGRQMAQLQPLVAELKEQYKDKKTGQVTNMQELQQKTMALYREYGINPMSGCLPALIQIPYFILIYQCMVQYRFEFQNGTFLWINPATSASLGSWIAPNLGERDYILIVIYACSMVLTTLLTPVSDPSNVKQQRLMGVGIAIVFSISMFFYPLPSAFVLYWVFTNVFATIQMLRAYRLPLPPLVKVNAPGGGVFPTAPAKTNGQVTGTGVPVKHRPKKKK